ncbi:MAG: 1-acyl-sn-glycerol-3-phosphate acyltransferase [Salinivirgaceae bacterium]|nr:1-acyl-sn-glycerol-3-phosphate acyltransferase [Salinivirgaceae bacterium]
MKKPIYKFSFGNGLAQRYANIFLFAFYKRFTIVGKKNIPKNKPVIFAINHQNALMDALTARAAMKGQPIFMTRADIFKKPAIAKILRFFKLLPIFRIRDGIKNLQNNNAVFEETIRVLENNKYLAILPEGSHFGQRRLRVLKKGLARIAFQAEERNNFELDVQVVPVGLDYTNYINFGSNVLVKFGEPFAISKFKDIFLENNQKGMNALTQELSERMISNMLHINDVDNYQEIEIIKDLCINNLVYNKEINSDHLSIVEKSQLIADKIIEIKQSDANKFNELSEKAIQVNKGINKLNLRYWTLNKSKYSIIGNLFNSLLQLILLPFFIFGFIPNIAPFYLPVYLSKNIKDPQFLSSVRFSISIFSFTIFYLIYLILLLVFIKPFYLALSVFVAFPFFGYFSFTYYVWVKKTFAKYRVNKLLRTKNMTWREVVRSNQEIVATIKSRLN